MAIIFLSGEMAGVGVLALPGAMAHTGPAGLALLVYFTLNAMFVGTRLGLCWIMIEEKYPEYAKECRDPYMVIAEKAGETFSPLMGKVFRYTVSSCITFTLYGACVLILVLMATFLENIFHELDVDLDKCFFALIVAGAMMPLCWLGTPADFWFVAVGALVSTVVGCLMIMVKEGMDVNDKESCYFEGEWKDWKVNRPAPASIADFGKAFSSIMFAFAGASTFPTIQADMKDKGKFPMAAIFAMLVLFMIYMPMSSVGWALLGDRVDASVVDSLCNGSVKVVVEILFLIHLISAFPIILNPPSQMFENILHIPANFGWKRVLFRSFVILILLMIGLSVPFFGVIVDLIGSTTITVLNFIFPPFFYMRFIDNSKTRTIPLWIRVYCWHMVIIGTLGMGLSFYKAVDALIAEFAKEGEDPCWVTFFQ